jgi:hypothetical protein
MCAVHHWIRHGIGDGGIADANVPIVDWQLAGDDGGSVAVAIIGGLQRIALFFCGEQCQTLVVC